MYEYAKKMYGKPENKEVKTMLKLTKKQKRAIRKLLKEFEPELKKYGVEIRWDKLKE